MLTNLNETCQWQGALSNFLSKNFHERLSPKHWGGKSGDQFTPLVGFQSTTMNEAVLETSFSYNKKFRRIEDLLKRFKVKMSLLGLYADRAHPATPNGFLGIFLYQG